IGFFFLQLRDSFLENGHRALALIRIRAESFLEHYSAHAHLEHRVHHESGRAGVRVSRNSGVQTFDDSISRRIEKHLFSESFLALEASARFLRDQYPISAEAEAADDSVAHGCVESCRTRLANA